LIRLAVRCRPERVERVLAELVELAPGGVEEEEGDGYVELAIYGPPGELPELPELEAAAGDGLVEITSTEIPDDWADRWRDFHEPVVIAGGRLVVRSSWHQPHRAPAGLDVVINPGRAFGTGAHATTTMCLEILLELADAGEARDSMVDLGTGSGVLAIAAAKLGWGPVLGVDSEPAALDAASANAEANGVELELRRMNLRQDAPPAATTMVANLTAPLVVEVGARLAVPPVTLVCSGLLASEADRIADAVGATGLEAVDRRTSGDWAALLCRRAAG
jgi:ribosomal protein L11 methyltransferase